MGESGQPWLMPSSKRRVCHVPSAHLWWTVPHLFVEDGDEGEDFGKGICDDFEVQFMGDTADLVGEVKEDSPWEGRMSVDWVRERYFSTCNCIVLIMRFVPLGVPMA